MQQGGCANLVGIAWFIGVDGAITPEEINIPWQHRHRDRAAYSAPGNQGQCPLRKAVVDQEFVKKISQIGPPHRSYIGKQDEVTPIAHLRNDDGDQHRQNISVIMEEIGILASDFAIQAADDLVEISFCCRARL